MILGYNEENPWRQKRGKLPVVGVKKKEGIWKEGG